MLNNEATGEVPKHIPEGDFAFDEEVALIFDNMAIRSIPCYEEAHRLHASMLAARFSRYNGVKRVLDIGASTGTFLCELTRAMTGTNTVLSKEVSMTAIDVSKPMMAELQRKLPWVRCIVADAAADEVYLPHGTYDAISMFYVLQFMTPEQRMIVLRKVYQALRPHGMLILGQKDSPTILASDKANEYHKFRLSNGYSVDEVYHKSRALAKGMQPITTSQLKGMLAAAGFKVDMVEESTRWLQFSTLIAMKE